MTGQTVVARLAGELVGRYRINMPQPSESGRRTPPQVADYIAEARKRLFLQGVSRDDLDRAEFEVFDL